MKKLFLLLILLPGLAWGGHFGSSTSGKEATVSWSYNSICDSAWMVFGYDGDAGDPDSANMYDSLKLVHCFSGTGRELCGDGLDLDSIGSHVVRMYCFSGDAVVGIRVGKWEQKAPPGSFMADVSGLSTHDASDVWAEDTGGVALTKYGGAILDYNNYKYGGGADSMRSYLATHDSTLLELAAACGFGSGSDTLDIMVFDGDNTAVEGVTITIYNPTKTAKVIPEVKTDVNGYVQVFLNPASYPCWVRRLGVILAEWDTVTVPSGGGRDTIWVVAQDPGSPPSGDLTQVKGYIRTMTDDQYKKGWIEFAYHDANIMDTSVSPAVYVDPTPITTQVDTGGFVVNLKSSLNLLSIVQDGPDKDSITYDVTIWAPGQTTFRWFNVFIPDSSGAVWLEDLID